MSQPRPFAIIGVPSSAGAFAPGQERAPAVLREAGLLDRLAAAEIPIVDYGDSSVWRWRPDRQQPDAQNLGAVVDTVQETAARVQSAVAAGQIPLVLGGDCTIELGTVAGFLSSSDSIGLLYLDKHADLNVPAAVPDGALDWMGPAHLLGEEGSRPELGRIGPRYPMLSDADICVIGHRPERATAFERDVLARRGLRTISDVEVARDPEGAAMAALATLNGHDRLLVHFDVDVIDFIDAPLSEHTGRNEGLTLDQAMRVLRVFAASPAFAALTITELNPAHGEADNATLNRFVSGLVAALVGEHAHP